MSYPRPSCGAKAELGFESGLFGSCIIALTGNVLLSFDVASVPHMVRGRAVNSSGVAVQGSEQLLAPEIGEGVGQLGSCPEDQVMEEPGGGYLLEGISFVLLIIILLVKGSVGDWEGCISVSCQGRGKGSCATCSSGQDKIVRPLV